MSSLLRFFLSMLLKIKIVSSWLFHFSSVFVFVFLVHAATKRQKMNLDKDLMLIIGKYSPADVVVIHSCVKG